MKSTSHKLQVIVSACAATNPDIARRYSLNADGWQRAAQIRRADVVAALLLDRSSARCARNLAEIDFWWNLSRDNLASQSDECIGFAYDCLTHRRT